MKITNVKVRSVESNMPAALDKCNLAEGLRHRLPSDMIVGYDAPMMPIRPIKPGPDGTVRKASDFLYIETDEGITGIAGPIASPFPKQGGAIDLYQFADTLKGEDPFNTDRIWEMMYRTCLKVGFREHRAISAIDIALWDIKCKALNVPLYKLMGGKTQPEMPVYASSVGAAYVDGNYDLELVKEHTQMTIRQGYAGAKWWIHRGPSDGDKGVRDMVELVKTIREAAGPDYKIMIDCWCGWTYEFAMRVCERIAEYDIFFLEEVLLPMQVNQIAKLSQDSPVRIALGEHLTTRYDFLRHIDAGFEGLFQPDPYWMGGITEFKKVMGLLTAYDYPVSLHGSCPPVCVDLSAAYPINVLPISEYLINMMESLEYFYRYPAHPQNGKFLVEDAPGCHLDVDESKVEKESWIEL